jgi:sortase A
VSCGAPARQVGKPVEYAVPAGVVTAQPPEPVTTPLAEPEPTPSEAPPAAPIAARPRPAPRARPIRAVAQPRPRPVDGGLFTIEIPKLRLAARVHEGQSAAVLARGPGHKPGSAMPGERGNVVIPGHRTVAPRPFFDIDQLRPGDAITLVDGDRRFVYEVTGSLIVSPEDGSVAEPTSDATLTIYACHP